MPRKAVYDRCVECGRPKGKTDRKLCPSCAAKRWWSVGNRREKKREAMNDYWSDPNNIEKASQNSKRIWSSEELRERQRQTQIERWSDPELREQKRQEVLEMWQDQEYRESMDAIYQSEEHREKISEAVTGHWQDPDIRAAHLNAMRTDEYREKQSAIGKERYKDPAARRKTGIASKRAWARPGVKDKWFSSSTTRWNTDWLEDYPDEFDESLKALIRRRDGYRCAICSMSQRRHGKLLFVHHIDYDKNNCDPDNLISLCNSCHSKTNWDRSHWEKALRVMCRQRECHATD